MNVAVYVFLVGSALSGLAVVFTGIGLLSRCAFGLKNLDLRKLTLATWVGWGLAVCFLQLWHLFFPVDWRPLAFLSGLGVLGIAWNMKEVSLLFRNSRPARYAFFPLAVGAAFWVACHTAAGPCHYDSGFYYLTAIRWTYSYSIVPGLGNLVCMLGFNNSYFLYASMLDIGPFAYRCHHLASGLLLLFLFTRILASSCALFLRQDNVKLYQVFDFLFLVPSIVLVVDGYEWRSSPSPDLAVYVLEILIGSELLRMLSKNGSSRQVGNADEIGYTAFTVILVSAIGITVKLSFASFGILASLLAVVSGWAQRRSVWPFSRKTLCWMLLAVAAAIIPWMIRGVILTGYIGYPATIAGFPVEWRIPAESAKNHLRIITAWARTPRMPAGEVLSGGWNWLWPWVNRVIRKPFETVTPMMLGVVASPLLLLVGKKTGGAAVGSKLPWLFMLVPAGGLVFWFFTAPCLRFAGSLFWLFGVGALALALRQMERSMIPALVLTLNIALFAQNVNPIDFLHEWNRDIGPAPRVEVKAMKTESGLTVYVPKEGDQCWDAPLPCTPYFNPKLRLRVPGDLSKGFMVGSEGDVESGIMGDGK